MSTPNPDALVETIRGALLAANEDVYGDEGNKDALAALSTLSDLLRQAQGERDEWKRCAAIEARKRLGRK